jgi:NADPH-dependent ferric siderophore reductase
MLEAIERPVLYARVDRDHSTQETVEERLAEHIVPQTVQTWLAGAAGSPCESRPFVRLRLSSTTASVSRLKPFG